MNVSSEEEEAIRRFRGVDFIAIFDRNVLEILAGHTF